MMVDRCPDSYDYEDDTRIYCESSDIDAHDVIALLPVFSDEGVVFKNIFCAACHGFLPSYVREWVALLGYFPGITNTDPIWGIVVPGFSLGELFFTSNLNESKGTARPCFLDSAIISTCDQGFNDSQTIAACELYMSPIYYNAQDAYYRNPHCFQCNNVDDLLPASYCDPICITQCVAEPKGPCFFQCTIHATMSMEHMVIPAPILNSTNDYILFDCVGSNQVFDRFLNTCRTLFCPEGEILKNGSCFTSSSQSHIDSHNAVTVLIDCMDAESLMMDVGDQVLFCDGNSTSELQCSPLSESSVHKTKVFVADNKTEAEVIDQRLRRLFENTSAAEWTDDCGSNEFQAEELVVVVNDVLTLAAEECYIPISSINESTLQSTQNPSKYLVYVRYARVEADTNNVLFERYSISLSCFSVAFHSTGCVTETHSLAEFEVTSTGLTHKDTGTQISTNDYTLYDESLVVICEGVVPAPLKYSKVLDTTLKSINTIGTFLSLVALLFLSKKAASGARCQQGWAFMLIVLSCSLFLRLLSFLITHFLHVYSACVFFAALAHCSFLITYYAAMTLAISTAHCLRKAIQRDKGKNAKTSAKGILLQCMVSIGIPFLLTGAALMFHFGEILADFRYGPRYFCWLSSGSALLFLEAVPAAAALLVSFVATILSVLALRRKQVRDMVSEVARIGIKVCAYSVGLL